MKSFNHSKIFSGYFVIYLGQKDKKYKNLDFTKTILPRPWLKRMLIKFLLYILLRPAFIIFKLFF